MPPRHPPATITTCALTLLVAALLAPLTTAQPGNNPTADPKAELQQLVAQRDRAIHRLAKLDREAADAIRRGENPVTTYAEQIGLQDRLDLLRLRIDLLATRLGVDVPPAPDPLDDQTSDAAAAAGSEAAIVQRANSAFDRGRTRAMRVLRADAHRLLASIDFAAFLNTDPQGNPVDPDDNHPDN